VRVLVNLTWLRPGRVGGSEGYLTRLLTGPFSAEVDLHLATQPSFRPAHPDLDAGRTEHVAPAAVAWGRPARVAVESSWLVRLARHIGADLVHHSGGTLPPRTAQPNLLTIHDLQYLAFPEYFHPLKRAYLRRAVPSSVRRATVVATPSHHAAAMVTDLLGKPGGDVVVVPHGIDAPTYCSVADELARPVPGPYLLYPAVTWPHKNHRVLLQALASSGLRDLAVVLTGAAGPAEADVRRAVAELGVADRVLHLGRVPASHLDALYRGATALVFPSRFEGFGAPVVEARWRDCPVVAADATALPEVVGEAGMLVSPDDVDAWVAAIVAVCEPGRRAELVDAGRRRAQCFSVQRAAAAQVQAWELALGR
jgi:glycosyltransferase involved in cell wall biosynthesis